MCSKLQNNVVSDLVTSDKNLGFDVKEKDRRVCEMIFGESEETVMLRLSQQKQCEMFQ